jgi:hypothetical protein
MAAYGKRLPANRPTTPSWRDVSPGPSGFNSAGTTVKRWHWRVCAGETGDLLTTLPEVRDHQGNRYPQNIARTSVRAVHAPTACVGFQSAPARPPVHAPLSARPPLTASCRSCPCGFRVRART